MSCPMNIFLFACISSAILLNESVVASILASTLAKDVLFSLQIEDFRKNLNRYHERISDRNLLNVTFSFWVITKDKGKVLTSLGRLPFNHSFNEFTLYIDADGFLAFCDYEGGLEANKWSKENGEGFISDGDWHNVIVVRDGHKIKLFLDARLVGSIGIDKQIPYPPLGLCFAADCKEQLNKTLYIEGMMDAFFIFGRPLTDSEVIFWHSLTPREVSPAPNAPLYNSFIQAFRRQLSTKVVNEITMHYVLNTMRHPDQSEAILEFGVWLGSSINLISGRFPEHQVYGFDSFLGLPEDWSFPWLMGSFNLNGFMPNVRNNVKLLKGWFNETLPVFAKDVLGEGHIALLHIDCDLYSSAKLVLDILADNIRPGTIIVFDELLNFPNYENHEMKAFFEFVTHRGVNFSIVAAQCVGGWHCQSVAIEII
jgi:hypothetical protein